MPLDLLPDAKRLFVVYSVHDDAVDQAQSDVTEYLRTGDVRFLRFLPRNPGEPGPIKFWCRALAWDEFLAVIGQARSEVDMIDTMCEVFRLGCRAFEGWMEEKGGKLLPFRVKIDERVGRAGRMADETFLRVPQEVAISVGSIIFAKSGLLPKMEQAIRDIDVEPSSEEVVDEAPPPEDEHLGNS